MTREEMLRRLGEGEDPLEIAIQKWEDIRLGAPSFYGANNCALCEYFHGEGHGCKYCPIYRYTKKVICAGTPYDEFLDHVLFCDKCLALDFCEKGRKIAYKEVKFLKKLNW